jgi:hypothetical protein
MRTTNSDYLYHTLHVILATLMHEVLDLLFSLIRSLLSHVREIKMTRSYRQIRTLNSTPLIGLSNSVVQSNRYQGRKLS